MFKSFGWFSKPKAQPLQDVPKSFTMDAENAVYKVSMNDTYSDFVDIDYKKLSYAEAASLSKNKKQSNRVPATPTMPRSASAARKPRENLEDSEEELLREKLKINNYYAKNKLFKQSNRLSSRTKNHR